MTTIETIQISDYSAMADDLYPIDGGTTHNLIRARLIAEEQVKHWGNGVVLLDLGDGSFFVYAKKSEERWF